MKFYITTAIIYTNAPPHIGFALELLQADVLARYHRFLGDRVFYLTGSDENGLKNQQTAHREGISPRELVDKNVKEVNELIRLLRISNDDFIRTSDEKCHWPAVKKIWQLLAKKGDLYKKSYQGLYCEGCEAFMTPKELKHDLCPRHQKKPEIVKEQNYFFRLSLYQKKLEKIIRQGILEIRPENRRQELLAFLKEGLRDVSFSRDRKTLFWGIPVPGDDKQTIYVWADALVNYISALGFAQKDSRLFKDFWPADIHLIGKDILRFHALIWPAMLLSAKLPLPKAIYAHGFITSSGQKMSKSIGNVISPFEAIKKYSGEALRYYLLREIPSAKDGDFTWEKLQERYNADLVFGLGNLVRRTFVLALKNSYFKKMPAQANFLKEIDSAWKAWKEKIEKFELNLALETSWQLISFCDGYLDKTAPWQEKNQSKFNQVISNVIETIYHLAWQIQPFLPKTSHQILSELGIKIEKNETLKKIRIKKIDRLNLSLGKPLFEKKEVKS